MNELNEFLSNEVSQKSSYSRSKVLDLFYAGTDGFVMNQFTQLIERNFEYEHTVRFYAEKLNISISTLNRLTKRLTGSSAYELIQDRLYQEAVTLLLHTSLTFKQISNYLGICDPAYFSRCFKNRTGHCPKEYRKRHS